MAALLEQLQRAADAGEIERWKAALLAEWLQSERGRAQPAPSPDDLAALLADEAVVAALEQRAPDGPWNVLAAQARSVRGHHRVGGALDELGSQPIAAPSPPSSR